jgi:CRP-like cAMP-binding protein
MSTTRYEQSTIGNWILNTLPGDEYARLEPYLKAVPLQLREVLYLTDAPIEYLYFPNRGMVSLVSLTEGGSTVEVGMVGNEGIVGVTAILGASSSPYQAEVQVTGDAFKMKADVLRTEFNRSSVLHEMLLRYMYVLIVQLSQSAVCNRFHKVEERLCRWLLVTRDRVKASEFQLTQQDLSHMIGSHRPSVTVVANALQKARLIRYNRGLVTLLDEAGLESSACECYRLVKEKCDHFYTTPP